MRIVKTVSHFVGFLWYIYNLFTPSTGLSSDLFLVIPFFFLYNSMRFPRFVYRRYFFCSLFMQP